MGPLFRPSDMALRSGSQKTLQAQTLTCMGMRQSVKFLSTRSGNSKLSCFLGIGRFLDLSTVWFNILVMSIHSSKKGGRGGGRWLPYRKDEDAWCKFWKKNAQKIPARSLRRLWPFLIYKTSFDVTNIIETVVIFIKITICLLLSRHDARSCFVGELLKFFCTPKSPGKRGHIVADTLLLIMFLRDSNFNTTN